MKANPGGQLNPEDIIGRGGDIDRLWEILAQQGVELTAERRMGKTTIVKQMARSPVDRTLDAIELAKRLLAGENIDTTDQELVATTIAQEVDRFPYYIHHLVRELKYTHQSVSPDLVIAKIEEALCTPQAWDMNHYRDRIDNYYEEDLREHVLAVLNTLAIEGLNLEEIKNRNPEIGEREILRKILNLLRQDGYLTLNPDHTYSFRYQLIRKYWQYR